MYSSQQWSLKIFLLAIQPLVYYAIQEHDCNCAWFDVDKVDFYKILPTVPREVSQGALFFREGKFTKYLQQLDEGMFADVLKNLGTMEGNQLVLQTPSKKQETTKTAKQKKSINAGTMFDTPIPNHRDVCFCVIL